ncbi:MAG: GlxA family transcriptional regulator [Pseudomonadota bacterium]
MTSTHQSDLQDRDRVGALVTVTSRTFGFVVTPNFSMMCLSAVFEPLRQANRLSGQPLYRWEFISADGDAVPSSAGVSVVVDGSLDGTMVYDSVVVCTGVGGETVRDSRLMAWLRRQARGGARIGAVSTGSFVLARAGLLHGHRSTVHWESLDTFTELFPDLDVTGALYELDGDRFTCSGGIASLDLMHAIIEADHGSELAGAVSEQFLHNHVRTGDDPQRMALRERLGVSHARLLKVIEDMELNLEDPLPRQTLAYSAGVSVRQLERLFRTHLGRTLGQYYLELRLRRARAMLKQTSQSVLDVAVACGFVSASHFSRAYRQRFGQAPRADRA